MYRVLKITSAEINKHARLIGTCSCGSPVFKNRHYALKELRKNRFYQCTAGAGGHRLADVIFRT